MMRPAANLFMTGNCSVHAYADAKHHDYSWESQLLLQPWLTTSRLRTDLGQIYWRFKRVLRLRRISSLIYSLPNRPYTWNIEFLLVQRRQRKYFYSFLLQPHDSRTTSVTGKTVRTLEAVNSPFILCSSNRADMRPSSAAGWRIVVTGGVIRE
jgi:hypothetical protein